MNGSLRQLPNAKDGRQRWELRVYSGIDPLTRRPTQKTRTVTGPRREADKAMRVLVREVEDGRHRRTAGTLAHLLTEWYDQMAPHWSPLTADRNRSLINNHIVPALGNRTLDKLGPADLDRLYRKLTAAGQAPASVRKVHYLLSGALKQARRWGWVQRNVAEDAAKPVLHRSEVRAPSPDQVLGAIAAAQARWPGYPMYLRLAATTGARRGELCALRATDVDFVEGGAHLRIVRAIIQPEGGGYVIKATKTEDGRSIVLDEDTAAMLAGHIDDLRRRSEDAGVGLIAEPYLFSWPIQARDPRLDGSRPWMPREMTRRWAWLRSEASAPDLRLHSLRHFAATQMLDAGVPVRTVSARLGHRQTSTTLNVYAAAVKGSDQAAADAIGKRLKGAADTP